MQSYAERGAASGFTHPLDGAGGGAANAAPFLFFTAIAQVAGAINAVRRLEAKGGAVSTEGVASC
ncbi:hypothetical protein [Klebsiella sp. Kd70 TUC-EEAOC]|uniref:hypothetical protein n=1 Tax=Klebsiella TaxID=570 RepID=UPI00115BDD8E|nr:hypothetical protein [Klebsiella sp. Kd70 TUC-EEAOC]